MKKYQQLLKSMEETENKEREISDKRDELFDKMFSGSKAGDDIKDIKVEDVILREQQEELLARYKSIKDQLEWTETDNYEYSAHFDYDGLYLRYRVIDIKEIPSFMKWLEKMNSEVA